MTAGVWKDVERQRARARALGKAHARHGLTGTPEHRVWIRMRQRCENEKDDHYKNYGARGIRVCERWQVFENFFADMGPRPGHEYTIERIHVNGNYEPGNCRWATNAEQQSNKTTSRKLTMGDMTLTVAEWARELGVNVNTLRYRVGCGWKIEDILTDFRKRGLRRERT